MKSNSRHQQRLRLGLGRLRAALVGVVVLVVFSSSEARAAGAAVASSLPSSPTSTLSSDENGPSDQDRALAEEAGIEAQLSSIGAEGAALEVREARAAKRRTSVRNEVLIIGSSSVRGTLGRIFVKRLTALGFDARRIGKSASGLSRPDYHDWMAEIDELPIGKNTLAVIVYVGVNDPQGLWLRPAERVSPGRKWHHWRVPAWSEVYRERVREMADRLCGLGVPDVIFLTPVDVRWRSLQARLVRIRRLQIEGTRESVCGQAFSASGDSLFIFGRSEVEQPRRLHDGYHLTDYGASLVFDRVRLRLLRLLKRRQLESKSEE